MTRQNDGRHHPGRSADRHLGRACGRQARPAPGGLGHAANRCSGTLRPMAETAPVTVRLSRHPSS